MDRRELTTHLLSSACGLRGFLLSDNLMIKRRACGGSQDRELLLSHLIMTAVSDAKWHHVDINMMLLHYTTINKRADLFQYIFLFHFKKTLCFSFIHCLSIFSLLLYYRIIVIIIIINIIPGTTFLCSPLLN